MTMQIRELTTIEECRAVAVLEREVWGYTDGEDVLPPPVLIVSIKRGGILLGAFEDGVMLGFAYSIPAVKAGQLTQWSHMLGVLAAARQKGLGLQLKLAQREHALRMGIKLIEWTYDPLQAANAHLNFTRLGIVVHEYELNIYGDSSSPLHRGTPTDRFVAEWHLDTPHVVRRLTAAGFGLVRDASLRDAPLVNPSIQKDRLCPGAAALDLSDRRVLVEIPVGFSELQNKDTGLALEWRMATRSIFQSYFSRGYRAVDFFLSRESRRGHYVLALRPDATT